MARHGDNKLNAAHRYRAAFDTRGHQGTPLRDPDRSRTAWTIAHRFTYSYCRANAPRSTIVRSGRGMRPATWLYNHFDVNAAVVSGARHTYQPHGGLDGRQQPSAVVGLCPDPRKPTWATESSRLSLYHAKAKAHLALGRTVTYPSAPIEELRWLEYVPTPAPRDCAMSRPRNASAMSACVCGTMHARRRRPGPGPAGGQPGRSASVPTMIVLDRQPARN